MSKMIFLFISLFFSSLGQAHIEPELIPFLQLIPLNQELKNLTTKNSCSEIDRDEVVLTDSYVKCARAICGKEEEVESYQEMIERMNLDNDSNEDEAFLKMSKELTTKSFDLEKDIKIALAPYINDFLKSKQDVSDAIKKQQFAAFILSQPMSIFIQNREEKLVDAIRQNGRIKLVFDYDKITKVVTEKYPNSTILQDLILQQIHAASTTVSLLQFYGAPAPVVIGEVEKTDDWINNLKIKYKSIPELLEKTLINLNIKGDIDEMKKNYNLSELEDLFRGDFPAYEKISEFMYIYYYLENTNRLYENLAFNQEYRNFDARQFVLKNYDNKISISEQVEYILKNEKSYEEILQEGKVFCESQINLSINALPGNDEILNFHKIVQEVKVHLKDRLFQKFSKHSNEVLSSLIDDLTILPPLSKEQYKKDLLADISEDIKSKRKTLDTILNKNKELIDSLVIENIQRGYELVEYEADGDDKYRIVGISRTLHDDIRSSCSYMTPSNLNDAFWPFKVGAVQVSWNSLKSKDFGRGVLIHELGHAISPYFKENLTSDASKIKYLNIRECLNDNHKGNGSPLPDCQDGDGHFTEEDWADFVSSITEKDKKNVGCFLVSQEKNLYQDLKLSRDEGPHSKPFYRALQVHLYMNGSYPSECKDLLSISDELPVRNCYDVLSK